ncbi:MAG: glycosyltransferase family 4 protein [Candidatus Omnitrophica bacterium]|nr:glycosyltransferase family 4 protein [Candidatus Omnitrophota bacterium]
MKVVLIGGSAIYVYQLASSLAKLGLEVKMLLEKEHYIEEFKEANFEIIKIFKKDDSYFKRVNKIFDWCKSFNPEIVHLQSTVSVRRDIFFLFKKEFLKYNLVYTAHNIIPHSWAFLENFALKLVYRRLPFIIVHANKNKEFLIKKFNIDSKKIYVIPHGIFNFYYRFTENITKEAARKFLGLEPDKKIILFFGNLRKNKGLIFLLHAHKKILAKIPDVKLLIVGPPVDQRPSEIYRWIEKLKISSSVIFIPKFVPHSQVGFYFKASDLVALPYLNISQSGVALTAIAYGLPLVVTGVGGLPEVVFDKKNGLIVKPKNIKDLSEAIIYILTNQKVYFDMQNYNLKIARDIFNWDDIAKKTIEVYEKATEQL